jgi:hypothetical protein
MDTRQKAILRDIVTVIAITAIAVVAIIILRNYVNRSEAMRAMQDLGRKVLEYRKAHGSVPPQSYVDGIKANLEGSVRLRGLRYRGLAINSESQPDEILAYTEGVYRSLFSGSRVLVLRLNGAVEWMEKEKFDKLLPEEKRKLEMQQQQREM